MWLERLGTGMGTGKEGRDVGKRKLGDVCAVVDSDSLEGKTCWKSLFGFFFRHPGGILPCDVSKTLCLHLTVHSNCPFYPIKKETRVHACEQ